MKIFLVGHEGLVRSAILRNLIKHKYKNLILADRKKLNLNVKIKFDKSKPDGVRRNVLDVSLAKKYGWKSKTSLNDGFDIAYKDFLDTINH